MEPITTTNATPNSQEIYDNLINGNYETRTTLGSIEYNTDDAIKTARIVTIEALDNGYRVLVGCQAFAFETLDSMMLKLIKYLGDPKGVEDRYRREGYKAV